jgi:aminoglycoside phosphotransferase (APT) family kinase protein
VTAADLVSRLRSAGLAENGEVRLAPLRGGVSSDIHLVETADRKFVVKAALAKLRVKDDWFADVSRNAVEQDYFAYAARIAPEAVPRILAGDPAEGWFVMAYLGEGLGTWKERLMAADAQPTHARRAGEVLGKIHRASWGDPAARERFATLANFHALRIEPYLLTTAERLPVAWTALVAEANRLAGTQLALVHGDYSPKNLLVGADRLVVLDAECGWFGDPAFDTAFLLTHLHLKALLHAAQPEPLLALVPEFWAAYITALGPHADRELEARTTRLLLGLMLARVHGKSPVEYITTPAQRDCVTAFALPRLAQPPAHLSALTGDWRVQISRR